MSDYIHLFETESAFTQEYDGEGYGEPWVSYTFENGKVDYNKAPSFLRILWETSGFTNPMPQKVLLNYGYDEDYNEPTLSMTDITNYDVNNPLGKETWFDFSESIAVGKYRIVDESDFTRADWDDAECIGVYFLWELDENGFPDGWEEYPEVGGIYSASRDYYGTGEWQLWGTDITRCCKLEPNGIWYGLGIYGD